ncbi:MAG: YggT family protein [Clostridia bacterium]|nr:YggT family protein [Clostridia bacterium]
MFSIISTLLSLLNTAILLYCILSFVAPNSSIMDAVRPYADMILDPFRKLIYSIFPSAANSGMDFSPVLLYLAIGLVRRLLGLFF